MKSNMQELFNEVFPDYQQKGHFDIDEFVDEVLSKHLLYEEPSEEELLRMVIKSRAEIFCNQHNCYSYARNKFVLLDMAVLADLMNIDESFEKDIKARKETLKKIKQLESGMIEGQQVMVLKEGTNDIEIIETKKLF